MANSQDLKKVVDEMNTMISQGKLLDAFEKYYADNVTMQENESEPRVGKEKNREFETEFVNGITKVNEISPLGVATGENISMTEWQFDLSHKEFGPIKRRQIAVQRWENGKIVNERFYYGND